LTKLQDAPSHAQAAELLAANGHLVLSALHAEEAAETAAGKLDELAQSSQRDPLTGTLNRAVMLDRLDTAATLARRRGSRLAVLFLDLDRFKEINDSLGHAAGDEVLQLVAKRMGATLRDSDTVSRHGGDEFLVLLPEVADSTDAAIAAAKVLLAIAGQSAADLIAAADTALYRSKRRGRGGFALHSEALLNEPVSLPRESDHVASDELLERVKALRRSNERLVISGLNARELEGHAREERQGQIDFLTAMAQELRDHQTAVSLGAEPVRARGDSSLLIRLQEALEHQATRLTS